MYAMFLIVGVIERWLQTHSIADIKARFNNGSMNFT